MPTLIERDGKLAIGKIALVELRLLEAAAYQPLSKWPQWRDAQINLALDSLTWFDLWTSPDGEYVFPLPDCKHVVTKRGHRARMALVFPDGESPVSEWWDEGEHPPFTTIAARIAGMWDIAVDNQRLMNVLAEFMMINAYVRAIDLITTNAGPFLLAVANYQWARALQLAREPQNEYPVDYLTMLVEG